MVESSRYRVWLLSRHIFVSQVVVAEDAVVVVADTVEVAAVGADTEVAVKDATALD